MPYIDKTIREKLDPDIDLLIKTILDNSTDTSKCGNANYTITRLMLGLYPELRYHSINEARGVLGCVADEFYRRHAAPYEDKKAIENGDVFIQQ